MSFESKLKLIIQEYIDHCNILLDYNYSPPREITKHIHGGLYYTDNDIRKIRRVEEPTFVGFAGWLRGDKKK